MSTSPLQVYSEIGPLKKVLVHRPGEEVERLTPELLERLLFDDIPFLEVARQEHDRFAEILQECGAEVYYLEDLMAESLVNDGVRQKFLEQFLDEAGLAHPDRREVLLAYLEQFNDRELIVNLMAGIRKKELPELETRSLQDRVEVDYPFIIDPMPNLYFTRDPFSAIGRGISLNRMQYETRNRETIFSEYIFKFHPDFEDADIPKWYGRFEDDPLEGGDQLILNSRVLAVGISERSRASAIENFSRRILAEETFETVLAFKIPSRRAFMHLDTVFTMVDHNKFTIHAEIEGPLKVFSLKLDADNNLIINQEMANLDQILKEYLNLDEVELIRCAGGDPIAGRRDQWNDGSNTLAVAPGEVVVYSRNYVTNKLLEEAGLNLHVMPSSELSRGRGGPRCMSMPLWREKL